MTHYIRNTKRTVKDSGFRHSDAGSEEINTIKNIWIQNLIGSWPSNVRPDAVIVQPPHLKQSHGSAGQRRPGPLRPGGRGSDPGRLDQDDHLDDGETKRAHGPKHADRARAAHELGLVEAGKVGEARRHRHPGEGSGGPERNQRRVRTKQQRLIIPTCCSWFWFFSSPQPEPGPNCFSTDPTSTRTGSEGLTD